VVVVVVVVMEENRKGGFVTNSKQYLCTTLEVGHLRGS